MLPFLCCWLFGYSRMNAKVKLELKLIAIDVHVTITSDSILALGLKRNNRLMFTK